MATQSHYSLHARRHRTVFSVVFGSQRDKERCRRHSETLMYNAAFLRKALCVTHVWWSCLRRCEGRG